MNKKLRTIRNATLLYTGLIIGGGLLFTSAFNVLREQEKEPAVREEMLDRSSYADKTGSFVDYSTSRSGIGNDQYIIDEDGNGTADIIQWGGNVSWRAEGHQSKRFRDSKWTRIMTPEIRDIATAALQSDRDLAHEIAKETYKSQQQSQESESEN